MSQPMFLSGGLVITSVERVDMQVFHTGKQSRDEAEAEPLDSPDPAVEEEAAAGKAPGGGNADDVAAAEQEPGHDLVDETPMRIPNGLLSPDNTAGAALGQLNALAIQQYLLP